MIGENIKKLRKEKKLTLSKLSKEVDVSTGYLSDIEKGHKNNPSVELLNKIAIALGVTLSQLLEPTPISDENLNKWNKKSNQIKEESALYETGEFNTPEAAMQFILKQPSIMGFGGFDTNKMSDEEIIEFANELLNQLKLLSYKYKK